MLINKIRLITQVVSFTILMYGGRLGIFLGHALPCFSCPYVYGCAGHCFLMLFQRVGFMGIAVWDKLFTYTEFINILYFLLFVILSIVLSKLWCGWICPFGSLLDMLSAIRRKLGIPKIELSWKTRDRLKPIKYVFLLIIFFIPFLLSFSLLPNEFYIFFCKICPGRYLLPVFAGDITKIAIDYSSWIAVFITSTGILFSALTIVGSFFIDRFFCMLCPMLPLIQLFKKISFIQFEKNSSHCSGCGNCQRLCSMNIRDIWQKKETGNAMSEDCVLCTQCLQACPQDNVLSLKFAGKTLFSSSKSFVLNKIKKLVGEKND